MSTSFHNMYIPLSTDIHTRLKAEAKRSGRPATVLVREAIEHGLWNGKQSNIFLIVDEARRETRRGLLGAFSASLRLGAEGSVARGHRFP